MSFNKKLSYSDYERLRSTSLETWSEDDLSNFLILDYFSVFKEIYGAEDVQSAFYRGTQFTVQKHKKYKLLFYFLDKIFLKLCFKNTKKQKKILFQNSKYPTFILSAKKHYSVGLITQGRKDRFFAVRNFIGYVGINDLEQLVLNYLKEGNIKYFNQLVKEVEDRLKIVSPDYVVLWGDGLSIERAIVLAGRKLGITTLVIQHGMYDSCAPLFNDLVADYALLWGQYYRDLFSEQKARKPEDIYVLGYPYPIKKTKENDKSKLHTVCYLAQDDERYNKDFLEIKLENVKQLFIICKKLGLKFIYRPHPYEDRRAVGKELSGVQFTSKKEKLEETFNRADVFVSFLSTSLIEATMRSKITLQLMNHPIKFDNFEKLGICNKSFQNINDLENYLIKITNAPDLEEFRPKFNNNYIETRYNSAERFLEILKIIEEKENKELVKK